MGVSPPKPVVDPVERFERDRKVLLSPDYREEQLPKAKTPHEQESIKRAIAAADKWMDQLVHESYGWLKPGYDVKHMRQA